MSRLNGIGVPDIDNEEEALDDINQRIIEFALKFHESTFVDTSSSIDPSDIQASIEVHETKELLSAKKYGTDSRSLHENVSGAKAIMTIPGIHESKKISMLAIMLYVFVALIGRCFVASLADLLYTEFRGCIYNYDWQSECIYSISKDHLNIDSACDVYLKRSWLLINKISFIPEMIHFLNANIIHLEMMCQFFICLFLLTSSHTCKLSEQIWWVYGLNPLIVIGGVIRPLASITHFLLLLLLFSSDVGNITFLALSLSCLFYCNSAYLTLLPLAIQRLMESRKNKKQKQGNSRKNGRVYAVTFWIVVLAIAVATRFDVDSILETSSLVGLIPAMKFDVLRNWFLDAIHRHLHSDFIEPMSTGIWWYLKIQVFKEFSDYYLLLLNLQPWLLALPVYLSIGRRNSQVAFYIMIAVISFCDANVNAADVFFVGSLMLSCSAVVTKMRNVPLIVCGLGASMLLSPLMLRLWTVSGSGNANFVFFQGLIMWVFAALGIVEYTLAALLVHSES